MKGTPHAVNHLSLCSGIGGLDLGLKRAVRGFRTIAYVEREAFAAGNLAAAAEAGALDPAPIFTDVHQFPWTWFAGKVDFISGGFPCQPFSMAGLRQGVDDPRHLWPSIVRGLEIVRPSIAFFENVDGITTAKSPGYHSVLHHVLSDLEKLGYRAEAGCFTAAEVGLPHQRKRWFIIGLADTDSGGLPVVGETHNHDGGDASRHDTDGRGASMADTSSSRCEDWLPDKADWSRAKELGDDCSGFDVRSPARPGEEQHEWEEPRTLEPGVGCPANGIPQRYFRLHCLGNAVVPAVAEHAFKTLYSKLRGGE